MNPAPDKLPPLRVDLFCQVIDNYGDAGVCWRLARQMVDERGWRVRLFIDRLDVLADLAETVLPDHDAQVCNGVLIHPWPEQAPDALGDVVIEAFGCQLPEALLDAMADEAQPPVWLNLEYLSAETWVEGCHGLPSPDPRRPLTKYFFFPGFTARTGGLLCERDYDTKRSTFLRDSQGANFLLRFGLPPEHRHDTTVVSLFCYANSPIDGLASAWRNAARPVVCLLPTGAPDDVMRVLGVGTEVGQSVTSGQLTTIVIPFLNSADYDRLLCACDLNFVRGEDSFLRAQWACRPAIWQPYRQADDHHRVKLDAFLERYLGALPLPTATALGNLSRAWSPLEYVKVGPQFGDIWNHLVSAVTDDAKLEAGLEAWSTSIRSAGNLLDRMAIFIQNKLK